MGPKCDRRFPGLSLSGSRRRAPDLSKWYEQYRSEFLPANLRKLGCNIASCSNHPDCGIPQCTGYVRAPKGTDGKHTRKHTPFFQFQNPKQCGPDYYYHTHGERTHRTCKPDKRRSVSDGGMYTGFTTTLPRTSLTGDAIGCGQRVGRSANSLGFVMTHPAERLGMFTPVSYTHLTLPTIYSV
eukprot:TRINITY_DN6586_c0_g1_i1.p1 TRINITY_DN6586_c0_g1~~TRINITY_DN6586_c0_g1_i1.p1  ORF type:complete len:183 (+),score=19.18 TRINITY_DN6586_c0_g1_i1:126-674(+)